MNIEGKTLRMLLRNGGIVWEFAGHGQGLVKDEELGVWSRRSKSPRRCSPVEPHPGASRHIAPEGPDSDLLPLLPGDKQRCWTFFS